MDTDIGEIRDTRLTENVFAIFPPMPVDNQMTTEQLQILESIYI